MAKTKEMESRIEELKANQDLVHTIAWEKDDFRSRYIWLNGNECSVVANEVIGSPIEGVEVEGAVRFYMQYPSGEWIKEDGEIKKEWKTGLVKWELIKMYYWMKKESK